jgi:hypothetical protein
MPDLLNLALGTSPSWSHLIVRVALAVVFFAHALVP